MKTRRANTDKPPEMTPMIWPVKPEEEPNDAATVIARHIIDSLPGFIEITGPLKQVQSVTGGWYLTWLSRGAEITFTVSNDREVWVFVGNVEDHFRWQVEDYGDVWVHVSSHLHNYQRW